VVVTVNPMATPITGTAHVCSGSTTLLSDVIAGGSWTSSDYTTAYSRPGIRTCIRIINRGSAQLPILRGADAGH
jgi:hypothetical protein